MRRNVDKRGASDSAPDQPMLGQDFLECTFSSEKLINIGTGTTTRKHMTKLLWHVEQKSDDQVLIRKINPHFVPVGEPEEITMEQLMAHFRPEVEIHTSKVAPAIQRLERTIERGDEHRSKGESLQAEDRYSDALEVDEKNVRAIFGLGLTYLQRGDKDRARDVFNELVTIDAAFKKDHKHLFNEFGISLRKSSMFTEAVQYYNRALDLAVEDDHLLYNLSRAYYELGDWENCIEFVDKALFINPNLREALNLCTLMEGLHRDKKLLLKYEKPPVPGTVASKAAELISLSEGLTPKKAKEDEAEK